jgi:hypothetical protein
MNRPEVARTTWLCPRCKHTFTVLVTLRRPPTCGCPSIQHRGTKQTVMQPVAR